MENTQYDIFISYKRKSLSMVHDSWFMIYESWISQAVEPSM